MIDEDEGPDEAIIVVYNAGTEKDNRLVDVIFVTDGEGLLLYFLVVANHYHVTKDGIDSESHGLQMSPKSHRIKPKKQDLASLGLHSDKLTRTLLANVVLNDAKIDLSNRLYSRPLRRYHPS